MEQTKKTKTSPRTRHIDNSGNPEYTNRLSLESSPYLLQHAHNPVNWYPWGKQAFETARRLDRPILLSIGYSTCHWCHVMEEESFEDMEIATYLNKHYVAIKVDREERPDIDSVYMKAVTALQGSGGWPMTVFITWDKKPFYGGTYFPARDGDRGAFPGFLTLLKRLDTAYRKDKSGIENAGHQITAMLKKMAKNQKEGILPSKKLISESIRSYKNGFDWKNGGLTGRTKFPSSLPLGFLMQYYQTSQDSRVLDMITLTLDKMMTGGIHDHVGGGFHRYTTDSIWLTPHYEKMLYDNAQLAVIYTMAFQLTGNKKYMQTARKTLDYLLKEMQSPKGGFYSATDADSPVPSGGQEEGYFFTWTTGEINDLFDERTSKIIHQYYGLKNTEVQRQILHISGQEKKIIKDFSLNPGELESLIKKANQTLYLKRLERPFPGRDDKIILSWNSLVISALAKAGFAFNETKYIDAAIKTHEFIFKNFWHDRQLFHSFKDRKRGHKGFLDDYVFLTAACIDLYEATFDIQWLLKAIDIEELTQKKFEDQTTGGFFMTPEDQKDLILREKPDSDGALPSGNAIAAMNLVRLYHYTDKKQYQDRAEKTLKYFSGQLSKSPGYMSGMLPVIEVLTSPASQIVIITPEDHRQAAMPFLDILRKLFGKWQTIVVVPEGKKFDIVSKVIPQVRGRKTLKGMTTLYLCEGNICRQPMTNPSLLQEKLKK